MDAGEGAILRPDAFCQRGSWNQTRGEFMRRSHVLSHEITHHLPSPGGVAFGTQMGSFVSQPSVSGAPSGGACRVGPGPYAALKAGSLGVVPLLTDPHCSLIGLGTVSRGQGSQGREVGVAGP